MKYLVLALALAAPSAFAQSSTLPDGFEVPAGCVYNGTKGQCVVTNHSKNTVTCTVETTGRTKRGVHIGNTRTLVIESQRWDSTKVFTSESDMFTEVSASATCK